MRIESSIEIEASPEKVWSIMYGKPENCLQWHPNLKRLEFVGEKRGGVGTMYYTEEIVSGRLIKFLCEVTELEEHRKFAFRQVLGSAT